MSPAESFTPYPRAQGPNAAAPLVLLVERQIGAGGSTRISTNTTGPLSERDARALLDLVRAGSVQGLVEVHPDDTIVDVGPDEVVIFGASLLLGPRHTRVRVARVRRAPSKG